MTAGGVRRARLLPRLLDLPAHVLRRVPGDPREDVRVGEAADVRPPRQYDESPVAADLEERLLLGAEGFVVVRLSIRWKPRFPATRVEAAFAG
ncbi:MAG TPA: hypothetical protein VGF17_25640 [Phytomonospora sp.]